MKKRGKMPANIDDIEELVDILDILKSFGLSTRGYKGVDDIKPKLREYLQSLEGSSKRTVGEVSRKLSVMCVISCFP